MSSTLIGTVSSLYARIAAADLARSTPGVADLCDRLALASVGDVSGRQHLEADPFDDIVAGLHTHRSRPQPAKTARHHPPAGMLRVTACLLAAATGILWFALVPPHPGAVVVVCLTGAATLAVTVDQTSS